jgi:hypothetical protein
MDLIHQLIDEENTTALSCILTRRQLMFREIFEAGVAFLASKNVLFVLFDAAPSVSVAARRMPVAA